MESTGAGETAEASVVVPVHEEPRHRLVHESPRVRLLDVVVLPGDTSLFHEHREPTLYVTLADALVVSQRPGHGWEQQRSGLRVLGEVTDRCDYFTDPLVHRVRNDGPAPFHLLAVLNPAAGEDGLAPTDDAELVNRWFVVRRLDAGVDETTSGVTRVLVHPASGTWQVVDPGQRPQSRDEGTTLEIQVGRLAGSRPWDDEGSAR